MQNSSKGTGTRWGLLFSFVVLALVAAVAVVPTQFEWEASGQGKGLHERTVSHVEGLRTTTSGRIRSHRKLKRPS
jgi:hypothetical protein